MSPATCPFCDSEQIERQLVTETRQFYLVADRFPIRPGHLLIVPRSHLACFGALPPEHDAELARLVETARDFLEAEVETPVLFEHGVAGQTVPHAHLHLLAGGPDLLDRIAPGRTVVPADGLDTVRRWHRERGPYLYWHGPSGAYLLSPEGVEPGFFKRVLEEAGALVPITSEAAKQQLQDAWQRFRIARGQRQVDVVTCFLWRDGRVCIFKRSELVGSARGKWHGVSGYLPEGVPPEEHARLEVEQETGLGAGQLGQLQSGSPMILGDPSNGLQWRVFPFRIEVLEGEPRLNWEHVDLAWVRPEDLRSYDTVRWLPALYERLQAELD